MCHSVAIRSADQLHFVYRLRAYILGWNEDSLSFEGNVMSDDTPDFVVVCKLGTMYFHIPVVIEHEIDKLASHQYNALERLAIFKKSGLRC